MYTRFGKLYWETRGGAPEKQKHCMQNSKTCNDFLDTMLDDAIGLGANIVFETTGTYYVDWLVSKVKDRYTVFYAFTILDFCENVSRNKTRAVTQMTEYIQDRSNPAPRLPDVKEDKFKMVVKDVFSNLWRLLGRKVMGALSDVEYIIVFDNSVRNISVLYDSSDGSSTYKLIRAILKIRKVMRVRRCYMRTH